MTKPAEPDDATLDAELARVDTVSLAELVSDQNTTLARSVRRVCAQARTGGSNYAAFGNVPR